MIKTCFNVNWKYRRLGEGEWTEVCLPHDAMIGEARSPKSAGGTNTGWFEGYDYEYAKTFFLPFDYCEKRITFEFEGVYRNAEVYINGKRAGYRPYGYTNFYVSAERFLDFGRENEIRVVARNADQPNSRWYSGAGIYRPVSMWVSDQRHILINGLKIRTLQIGPAKVEVRVLTSHAGEVRVALTRGGRPVAEAKGRAEEEPGGGFTALFALEIENAELWEPENPALYGCTAHFEGDVAEATFGIRTISCTATEGFVLNGRRVVLRGACIHHDNGILGARCYAEAEERKIRILKEYGYNAVRSAHNPCSKALLDACDRLGVMVMDEYADMWYIHKTKYDYADFLDEWWERDLADMIEKDYNHPSVVLYSLGNEVAETGQRRGVELFKKMRGVCRSLDDRPVTAGVNLFFNYLYSLGLGVYSDKKAEKRPDRKVGSEFFNQLAGKLGGAFMKRMAKLRGCDAKTRDCFAEMDVAGYNYGIMRYRRDIKKYPARAIVGSESFCSDAFAFWELAKRHRAIIGDFVWTGMDYLGEVGVGSWEYKDYAPDFSHGVGWIAAGSGRIDLIGNPLGEALYTKVAFELTNKPQIAVVPVGHTGERHSPSAWKFSNAIPSWSWNGQDGRRARVEVYSRAPRVELYLNGKRAGSKRFKKNCRFIFKIKYSGGELTAVNLNKEGRELSRNTLKTAGEETLLRLVPEKERVKIGEVCFIRICFTDGAGTVKPLERGVVQVSAEGGELLAAGNACPYNVFGYAAGKTDTYYGEAMAIIKALRPHVVVKASCGNYSAQVELVAE